MCVLLLCCCCGLGKTGKRGCFWPGASMHGIQISRLKLDGYQSQRDYLFITRMFGHLLLRHTSSTHLGETLGIEIYKFIFPKEGHFYGLE